MKREKKAAWISEQLCVQAAGTCNVYCAYCQNPPDGKMPPLARALAVIKKRGIKSVSLEGGGDPAANPLFPAIVARLRGAGVKNFMLSTNAVALADQALCRAAVRDMDFFTVNFPSHLPELYAKATRSVKFPQALAGLRNLKACGAENRIRLFHIISAFNYKALPGFAAWTAAHFPGVAFVNLTFVRNAGRVNDDPALVPRYRQAAPFVKIALAKLKLAGIKAVVQNFPLCQLENFEGFSFEFQRWRRGDKVLEAGVKTAAPCAECRRCALKPACCGARADYARIYGTAELKTSNRSPAGIRPEGF
ncbi:MAG: radical SAM protein [Elusimicrobiales bacterium]|nr:radical SAM protein [Elusimicrobiales bacterium]